METNGSECVSFSEDNPEHNAKAYLEDILKIHEGQYESLVYNVLC